MRTRLLRPSWLVMHVLVVLACCGMYRLGVWQWGRGHQTGSIRNYSYGLEWWAFVVLTALGWGKYCVDESAPAAAADPARPEPEPAAPAPALPLAVPVSAEEDPDLAAWNARFAELARRDAVARDAVARDAVARDAVARDAVARETSARDTSAVQA